MDVGLMTIAVQLCVGRLTGRSISNPPRSSSSSVLPRCRVEREDTPYRVTLSLISLMHPATIKLESVAKAAARSLLKSLHELEP